MSDQIPKSTEAPVSSENPTTVSIDRTESSQTTENAKESESIVVAKTSSRRSTMPQDIRYTTDQNDRNKLMTKYNDYQISDINACNIRFLIDNRQRKSLFGRNEEEHSNLQLLASTYNVNIYPAYQQPTKHSYKIFGTENNVRKCLIDIMIRIFRRLNESTQQDSKENENQQLTSELESIQECNTLSKTNDNSSSTTPTVVTTIHSDTIVSEVQKSIESHTEQNRQDNEAISESERTVDKLSEDLAKISTDTSVNEQKHTNTNDDETKFTPRERKRQYTFVMLISNQGQEVLKKNWNFFAGSLQQRLNVIVMNPVKLPKFGDKQVFNGLSITGDLVENLSDACLQIAAFINDVLGVSVQPYKFDDMSLKTDNDHNQRLKGDHYTYRPGTSHYQGRSSYNNNHHGRTFINRNHIMEQIVLIRSDCVPRIVGTKGSNLKRIQTKCYLRDMIVGRQVNENGYIECLLSAYQIRNINFAIQTIRSFLRNEDESAVLVPQVKQSESTSHGSPHLHELGPPSIEHSSTTSSESRQSIQETGFTTKSLNLGNSNSYTLPSYNFQHAPSFDFTHQATTASRKTDKRRGELHDHNKTPGEPQNQSSDNLASPQNSSNSPRHKSKRSCPETKEIDCTTDEGFWIQKRYYHALDDSSKQLFDSLMDKLEKIRIANEENAARKQQRLVGRNRSNKTRIHTSSVSYLNDDSNNTNNANSETTNEKELIIKSTPIDNSVKFDKSTDVNEEKENNQETSTAIVSQD